MAECPFCISRRGLVTRALGGALALGVAGRLAPAGTVKAQAPQLVSDLLGQGHTDYSDVVGGPADFYTYRLTFQPGTVIAWHIHPGPVYAVVNSGTLTVHYDSAGCQTDYPIGSAVTLPRNLTHEDHNDGTDVLEVISTFLMPAGSPLRVSVDAPIGSACILPAQQAAP